LGWTWRDPPLQFLPLTLEARFSSLLSHLLLNLGHFGPQICNTTWFAKNELAFCPSLFSHHRSPHSLSLQSPSTSLLVYSTRFPTIYTKV
jgi:hypothetical protein